MTLAVPTRTRDERVRSCAIALAGPLVGRRLGGAEPADQ